MHHISILDEQLIIVQHAITLFFRFVYVIFYVSRETSGSERAPLTKRARNRRNLSDFKTISD